MDYCNWQYFTVVTNRTARDRKSMPLIHPLGRGACAHIHVHLVALIKRESTFDRHQLLRVRVDGGCQHPAQTCESPYSTNSVVISQCLRIHAHKRARSPVGGDGAGGLLRNVSQGGASLILFFVVSGVQRTRPTLAVPLYLDLLQRGVPCTSAKDQTTIPCKHTHTLLCNPLVFMLHKLKKYS